MVGVVVVVVELDGDVLGCTVVGAIVAGYGAGAGGDWGVTTTGATVVVVVTLVVVVPPVLLVYPLVVVVPEVGATEVDDVLELSLVVGNACTCAPESILSDWVVKARTAKIAVAKNFIINMIEFDTNWF